MNDSVLLKFESQIARFDSLLGELRGGRRQVLVTVAQGKGSTPRDAGARMWVDGSGAIDTIGGGHLELQAIECARTMLAGTEPRRKIVRYALGPSLGQCCGGAVWLAFELLDQTDIPWCQDLVQALRAGSSTRRIVGLLDALPVRLEQVDADGLGLAPTRWEEESGVLYDTVVAGGLDVVVYGAGHVGHAIVRLLADLPVRVHWVDPRAEYLPRDPPANVQCIVGDDSDVIDLPDNAYWLVLTHSHALDLEVLQAVLRHKSFRFLGLIGSKTKRARFVSQLRQRFPEEQVQRIQCPIGLVATSSKLPSVIAVSVVAQLIPLIAI